MARLTFEYIEHGSPAQRDIVVPKLEAGLAAFAVWAHAVHERSVSLERVSLGSLTLWLPAFGDLDCVDLSFVRKEDLRLKPTWPAEHTAAFVLRNPECRAAVYARAVALYADRNSRFRQDPVAWTTARTIMHLDELGILMPVPQRFCLWSPAAAASAHQRLALPAEIQRLERRDAAIREDT
jgi:hypothetical protein